LVIQIETRLHERQGKAINNFPVALPPADSDMTAQIFKDPYIFDFLGTADPRREGELEQKPIGVAQWERHITQSLPNELKSSLPSVEEIEAELSGSSDE
jgi:predicted nuclease of restriction endonuclease-like (RecB) superfamily